jgi:hypothetical protein
MSRPTLPPSYVGGRIAIFLATLAALAILGRVAVSLGAVGFVVEVGSRLAWSAKDLLWPW